MMKREIKEINENINNKQNNIKIKKMKKLYFKDLNVDEKENQFNIIGEKLYQKLKQKEEKLRQLKEETIKYLNGNEYTNNFSDYLNGI